MDKLPRRSFFAAATGFFAGLVTPGTLTTFLSGKPRPAPKTDALVIPIKADWKEFEGEWWALRNEYERRLARKALLETEEFHTPNLWGKPCDLILADGSNTWRKRFGDKAKLFLDGEDVTVQAFAACLTCGWVRCYKRHPGEGKLPGRVMVDPATGAKLVYSRYGHLQIKQGPNLVVYECGAHREPLPDYTAQAQQVLEALQKNQSVMFEYGQL